MTPPTPRERAATLYGLRVFSRLDLTTAGMTWRDIERSVAAGRLQRLRRDCYAVPGLPEGVVEAVRIGGRLSCVSLLAEVGVFVHVRGPLHVHMDRAASRIRSPRSTKTILHWHASGGEPGADHAVSLPEALAEAVRCQSPRATIATVDSILHHGLMSEDEVAAVFAGLPMRFRALLSLVDPSAESGPETFMRLILRALGVSFHTQVYIDGVGRVDFVVEGWLIVECDSRGFHEGWDKQVEDRRRDMAAAKRGYVTIRPLAADILRPESGLGAEILAIRDALRPRSRR